MITPGVCGGVGVRFARLQYVLIMRKAATHITQLLKGF